MPPLVAPSGIALIGIRWGSRYSLCCVSGSFCPRFAFSRTINGNGYYFGIFLPSIFLGEAFRANWSFGKLIVIPAIALTLTSLIGILISAGLTSFDLSQISRMIDVDLKNAIIESVKQQPMTQEQMDAYINRLDFAFQQVKRMLLAYWFAANAIVIYILAKLVSYIGRRTNSVMRTLPTMDTWRMPLWGGWCTSGWYNPCLCWAISLAILKVFFADVGLNLALLVL